MTTRGGAISEREDVNIYQKLKAAVLVGAILTAAMLVGCGGKTETDEVVSTPANPTGAGGIPQTSNQMPPEAKARMDQQQADMKARADAQGKAMMQGQQPGAPK